MTIRQKLEKLKNERNTPCVTISLNTHRTHPDNAQDAVLLKNLLKEAEERVVSEFGIRPVSSLLRRLSEIEKEIDINYSLDSLHIYLSNDTKEIIKSAWSVYESGVHISNTFNTRSLIKSYNRSEEYFILLLSQSDATLYKKTINSTVNEIKNDDFPFSENRHFNTHSDSGSDSKHRDDSAHEFLKKADKAVVKMNNETGLNCVVISTAENYSSLMQVADTPSVYIGYSRIDYNNTAKHNIAEQSSELLENLQHKLRDKAIEEMEEAVAQGDILTDFEEIFRESFDGRGDLSIDYQNFYQPEIIFIVHLN